MAYIAMYSPRPGAASFAWQDDVDHAVKKERYAVLTEDLEKVAVVHTRELEGKTVRMLVRGKDRKEGYLSGHTEGKIIVRFASEDESLIGSFVDVQIESVRPFSAEGKLVNAAVTL
jgi:tRNA-2-methylthio-N6-dimethylallyladenosine synthase